MRNLKMKISLSSLALVVASLTVTTGTAAANEPAFVLQTADSAMYGTRQVDEGRFDAGAERLERMLSVAGSSLSKRQPALNDLCVSYTMLGDLDAAQARCEESVANGRDMGIALNNRGVMRIRSGDYDGAVSDFLAALEAGGARAAAETNLALAQQRVAERQGDEPTERAADNDSDKALERTGDERAAVVEATIERFAETIEAETVRLATVGFTNLRG